MGTIILELSFLLYKASGISEIQETIRYVIEKSQIEKYYLDFEIENRNRLQEKGLYTIHFEDNDMTIKDVLFFLRKIKNIPNTYLECIYRDNVKCEIIYASKYYLSQMEKDTRDMYNDERKLRSYSETEFEILKGIDIIFKKKKTFNGSPPATYDDYLSGLAPPVRSFSREIGK